MVMTFLVIEILYHFWDYPNEVDCTHLNNLYCNITQLNDVGFQTQILTSAGEAGGCSLHGFTPVVPVFRETVDHCSRLGCLFLPLLSETGRHSQMILAYKDNKTTSALHSATTCSGIGHMTIIVEKSLTMSLANMSQLFASHFISGNKACFILHL